MDGHTTIDASSAPQGLAALGASLRPTTHHRCALSVTGRLALRSPSRRIVAVFVPECDCPY